MDRAAKGRAMIAGVILDGGRASRMGGGDKGLRRLAGQPLIGHVMGRLAPQVAALAISGRDGVAGFGLPVLADSVAGQPGPLAGVLAAMDWAAGLGAAQVVTVAADTPFIPRDLVARLAAAGDVAVAASADGAEGVRVHPVCALWPVRLREGLRAALAAGERRVGLWAAQHGAVEVVFAAVPFDPFFNINTPADLALAETLAAAAP
jgi:molybdenum cofactor guanylyltransferase